MSSKNIWTIIESMNDSEIQSQLKHVQSEMESFAEIYGLDYNANGTPKRVISDAVGFDELMTHSTKYEKDEPGLENCVALIMNIKSIDLNKVEKIFYLARKIASEFYMVNGIT